ncbi:MAG: nucleoside-diphosphate-sugar epimerase [Parasphingorhabdus sp.]|jgi:nucleoside-diphosphate-sugar epimerase
MSLDPGKYLVTGGASFIGSHLVEELLRLGCDVRVADDLSSGKLENLSSVIKDIEFAKGNLRDLNFSIAATSGCDAIFHLAADHGGRGYIATHPANCAGNMALDNIVYESAVKSGVEQITFVSSACVYPTNIQEDKNLLQENMVDFSKQGGAFADEEYGWAKLMGELSLKAYHKQYGIRSSSARLSTAYGPRENESHALIALIAKAFVKQTPYEIWGTGEQTRGFTYVDDIVQGIVLAAKFIEDGSAMNVGTSEYISLNRIAAEIFKILDWEPPGGITYLLDKPVGVLHRALDGGHAFKRTGWLPKMLLEDGIKKTIDWYINTHTMESVRHNLSSLLMQR